MNFFIIDIFLENFTASGKAIAIFFVSLIWRSINFFADSRFDILI